MRTRTGTRAKTGWDWFPKIRGRVTGAPAGYADPGAHHVGRHNGRPSGSTRKDGWIGFLPRDTWVLHVQPRTRTVAGRPVRLQRWTGTRTCRRQRQQCGRVPNGVMSHKAPVPTGWGDSGKGGENALQDGRRFPYTPNNLHYTAHEDRPKRSRLRSSPPAAGGRPYRHPPMFASELSAKR